MYTDVTFSVFIILVVIMLGLVILFAVLAARERVLRVNPSDCPAILGTYAVNPGHSSTVLGKSFPANDLTQAISICDQLPAECSAFAFSPKQNLIYFINSSNQIQKDQSFDLYSRQI